jgi:hypothetical protein
MTFFTCKFWKPYSHILFLSWSLPSALKTFPPFSACPHFSVQVGVKIYFCPPHFFNVGGARAPLPRGSYVPDIYP